MDGHLGHVLGWFRRSSSNPRHGWRPCEYGLITLLAIRPCKLRKSRVSRIKEGSRLTPCLRFVFAALHTVVRRLLVQSRSPLASRLASAPEAPLRSVHGCRALPRLGGRQRPPRSRRSAA